MLEDPHWPSQPEDPAGYGIAQCRSDLATDKVKPLDELLEVGCRNNPGWVAEDLEPRPESTRPSTPAVPNWLYASYDIDRWRDTMARSPVPPCVTGDPGVAPNVTVRAEGRAAGPRAVSQLTIVHIRGAGTVFIPTNSGPTSPQSRLSPMKGSWTSK